MLVEGGAAIAGAFIAAGLVDRIALFVAPKLLGGGVAVAAGADLPVARALRLGPISGRSRWGPICCSPPTSIEADPTLSALRML